MRFNDTPSSDEDGEDLEGLIGGDDDDESADDDLAALVGDGPDDDGVPSIGDAAAVLGRNYAAVHKYAEKHGFRFGRRPRRDLLPTMADILALDDPEAMERRGEGEGDCGD